MPASLPSPDYGPAYAHWAPIMRERWVTPGYLPHRAAAKRDILETLALHPDLSAYSAKLWAELDAIRDAELADRR